MPDQPPAARRVLPRFSVVIPTYRRNDALARCLNRLMADRQTLPFEQYEVIVTDDGPADETNARLLVKHTYPWVRWVPGPRRGPAANRNRGAAEATGEWLVFTDDDCLPRETWLAEFARKLDGPEGDRWRVLEGRTTPGDGPPLGPRFTAPVNETGGFLWSCNVAIRREFFAELGGFDERFPFPHLEDVDLRLRLDDRHEAYPFVPEAVVDHPPRPEASAMAWARSRESAFYLAQKRDVPLSAIHFGPYGYLRGCYNAFRDSRNAGDFLWSLRRMLTEIVLLAWYIPRWRAKYPKPG